MYPYSYRGLFILYRNSYLCVTKTVHLLFPCITCLFLAAGHIGVSSWPNRRLLLTLVLSVLFPICLSGRQQGRICTKFLSQYPAQTWMQPTECIPFDGKGSGVSSTGRLCPLSPRDPHTNKAGRVEVSGRRNWQKTEFLLLDWHKEKQQNPVSPNSKCVKRHVFWNYDWCGERPWCPFTVHNMSQRILWARAWLTWAGGNVQMLDRWVSGGIGIQISHGGDLG